MLRPSERGWSDVWRNCEGIWSSPLRIGDESVTKSADVALIPLIRLISDSRTHTSAMGSSFTALAVLILDRATSLPSVVRSGRDAGPYPSCGVGRPAARLLAAQASSNFGVQHIDDLVSDAFKRFSYL